MQLNQICEQLETYIALEVLEGKSIGLDNKSPLLEWGIINSLEIVRLSNFIKDNFDVTIPYEMMTAENLQDIDSIGRLILDLQVQP